MLTHLLAFLLACALTVALLTLRAFLGRPRKRRTYRVYLLYDPACWTPPHSQNLPVRKRQKRGLFSGVTQDLKEDTLTAEYKFAEGFVSRLEYRRDFSNRPFFLTHTPGVLRREQQTATLGLIWWFGRKQGTW